MNILKDEYEISERKACSLVGVYRSFARYRSNKKDESEIVEKIKQIAWEKRRFGYRRIHMMLKRSGLKINHKRVYGIYQVCGLKVVKRGGRKRAIGARKVERLVQKPNQQWAIDFMQDSLANGRRIRLLNVIDTFTRQSLKIVVDTSIGGRRVVRELEELVEQKGHPQVIVTDNGTEFTSNHVINWCQEKSINWEYIQPGKP